MMMEEHKIDGDLATTDGQVPDAPARPMMQENTASNKRDQHIPPEVAERQRQHVATKNSDETSEELHAEEELQGEPGPPAQKSASSKIKPTIPVYNDDLSLADTWGDYNFAQAEAAAAAMDLEQAEIAAASASQAVYSIDEQGGASRSRASSAAQARTRCSRRSKRWKRTCTKPKNSRKGDIDGPEAEQHKANGKSHPPKGGAAYEIGSHGK